MCWDKIKDFFRVPDPSGKIEPDIVEPDIVEPDIVELEEPEIIEENMWTQLKPLPNDAGNVVDVPWIKYYKVEHPKKQIVLHHTVSGPGIAGDLATWRNFTNHIATCVIIDRDGTINRLFSSKYWGFHIGANNRVLDQQSIGIEIDSWGPLIKGDGTLYRFSSTRSIVTEPGKFYNIYGYKVDVPYIHYPDKFRGYEYYEAYTFEQIWSVGQLLLLWRNLYGIPLDYKEDIWEVSQRALSGTSGVWSHTSYRAPAAKQDAHPQPELIKMLKTLSSIG